MYNIGNFIFVLNWVKVLSFERIMTPKQVSNVIRRGFVDLKLQIWTYLEASQDGVLNECTNQEMD